MVRYRLMELMAERQISTQRRVTVEEVARESKVHRIALHKMLHKPGHKVSLETIEKLCAYFKVGIEKLVYFEK